MTRLMTSASSGAKLSAEILKKSDQGQLFREKVRFRLRVSSFKFLVGGTNYAISSFGQIKLQLRFHPDSSEAEVLRRDSNRLRRIKNGPGNGSDLRVESGFKKIHSNV